MEVHVLEALGEVGSGEWDSLLGTDQPFLSHGFLHALEAHGCLGPEQGWIPQHLLVYQGDQLLAAAPAYLKLHSWGEFVFDFAWADAYARHGLDYYPKLVVAAPLTPVTGPRILVRDENQRPQAEAALAAAALELCRRLGLSSVHWLFPEAGLAHRLQAAGWGLRMGCQYHWQNPGYRDFDDFLDGFSSKKRKNIRRERRRVAEAGVEMAVHEGPDVSPELWSAMHRFYRDTFLAHGNPPVMSEAFFRELGERLASKVVVVEARRHGRPIAGALCLQDAAALYGRYWGCDQELDGLHFETCYYQGIEHCIARGLGRFEPGAQGRHKIPRGFLPTPTYSCHHLEHPDFQRAVDEFLGRERTAVSGYIEDARRQGPFRSEVLERLSREGLPR